MPRLLDIVIIMGVVTLLAFNSTYAADKALLIGVGKYQDIFPRFAWD